MKKTPATILCLILTMTMATCAQVPRHGATALIIIADSSWSCEQEIGDIMALTRQPITSLEPGDYLEIISERASKPQIQLAQTIRTGDAQEMKNIDTAIGRLRSYFLSDASLPNALDMAIRRVSDVCSKRQIEHVAIIILTDGQVNDSHARRILQLSERINANGWSLYLTGTKNTNSLLLIAASRGSLHWSLLSEASPELWLRQTRELSEPAKARESEPGPPPPQEGPSDPPDTQQTPKAEPQHGRGHSQPSEEKQDQISMEIGARVLLGSPGGRMGVGAVPAPEGVHETNEPAVRPATAFVPPKPSKPPATRQHWLPHMKAAVRRHWRLALLPFAALALGLIGVVVWATAKGRQWDRNLKDKTKSVRPRELRLFVLRHGDRIHQLGPIDKLPVVSVGRHSDNAIRLVDDSVRDHHLRIYRKGDGLVVQNLANTPIKVNSTEVKPRSRYRISLPGTIELNDKVKLTLEVQRAKLGRQEDGSISHEQPVEKALA
jgi:hypothetical protein